MFDDEEIVYLPMSLHSCVLERSVVSFSLAFVSAIACMM